MLFIMSISEDISWERLELPTRFCDLFNSSNHYIIVISRIRDQIATEKELGIT